MNPPRTRVELPKMRDNWVWMKGNSTRRSRVELPFNEDPISRILVIPQEYVEDSFIIPWVTWNIFGNKWSKYFWSKKSSTKILNYHTYSWITIPTVELPPTHYYWIIMLQKVLLMKFLVKIAKNILGNDFQYGRLNGPG